MTPSPARIKIAHFIHLDGPGGGPRSVMTQVSFYSSYYDLVVIHGGSGYIARACDSLGVPHVSIPTQRLGLSLWGFWILIYKLRRLKPDLIILHGQWAGVMGSVASRLAGVPLVQYIAHWPSFYTDWDLYRCTRNFWTEYISCRLANQVILLSASNRYQYLMRHLVPVEKIVLISNSIDLTSVPSWENGRTVRRSFQLSDDHVHVVSVGRLTDQKRVDWLLRAWAEIQAQAPYARLWIVGDGPDQPALEKLAAELKITDTCTFLGAQNEGIRFINASDIVVMTTMYEAFGNVGIEAMACGKPIIANEADGIRDTFTNGVEGYYVPPADPEALAASLLDLIQDPGKRKLMGENGMRSVLKYSKPDVSIKYLKAIESLLQENILQVP